MGQKEDLKAFNEIKGKLEELVRKNPAVFGELVGYVEKYNALVRKIRDDVKAEAKITGRKVRVGDFEAIPRDRTVFDLLAVEKLLKSSGPDGIKQWNDLIEKDLIKVTYSTDQKGVAAITALETRYPKLANLKGKETYRIDTPGPKEIGLGDIASVVENS